MEVQEAACKVNVLIPLPPPKKALTNGIKNPAYKLNVTEIKCKKDHQDW